MAKSLTHEIVFHTCVFLLYYGGLQFIRVFSSLEFSMGVLKSPELVWNFGKLAVRSEIFLVVAT